MANSKMNDLGLEPAMNFDDIARAIGVSRKTVQDDINSALDKLWIAFTLLGIQPEDFDE